MMTEYDARKMLDKGELQAAQEVCAAAEKNLKTSTRANVAAIAFEVFGTVMMLMQMQQGDEQKALQSLLSTISIGVVIHLVAKGYKDRAMESVAGRMEKVRQIGGASTVQDVLLEHPRLKTELENREIARLYPDA